MTPPRPDVGYTPTVEPPSDGPPSDKRMVLGWHSIFLDFAAVAIAFTLAVGGMLALFHFPFPSEAKLLVIGAIGGALGLTILILVILQTNAIVRQTNTLIRQTSQHVQETHQLVNSQLAEFKASLITLSQHEIAQQGITQQQTGYDAGVASERARHSTDEKETKGE